jgi:DNA-binding NarL/FixJ family response regulator
MSRTIRVLAIEDEEMVREGLVGLMRVQLDIEMIGTTDSVESALELALPDPPDIILLDIGLAGILSGLEGIRPLKARWPEADIIMLTTFEDSDRIFKALCAGASAYLTKRTPLPQIADAVRTVRSGGSYMSPTIARKVIDHFAPRERLNPGLTPRQSQIVEGIMEGLSYKLIADKLMITTETVRDHIKKIYRALDVNSKTELIRKRMSGEI